jgi:Tfp pilus assembly protein PilX
MLTSTHLKGSGMLVRQRGMVLLLSIIVLVAMSLAGIALMRSVFTSNRVAGNLAFQQSASASAEIGTESAIAWLEQQSRLWSAANTPANTLFNNISIGAGNPVAYRAVRQDPATNLGVGVPDQTWEQFWQQVAVANNWVNSLPVDAAGNTVSYIIQRLCSLTGDPMVSANCEGQPVQSSSVETSSRGSGVKLKLPGRIYYRITVRVAGPRNAVAFHQSIVSL